MKRFFLSLIYFLLIPSIITSTVAYSQSFSLFNKKDDLKDFTSRTLKVVLDGNGSLDDVMLMDAVKEHWSLSPYEFCTLDEFQTMMADTNYYFLVKVDGQFCKENEPAMEFLSLLKGVEGATDLNALSEVLSLPYRPLNDKSGDSYGYLPPFINVIQAHVLKVQRNKLSAYIGVGAYSDGMDGAKGKHLYLSEDDFLFEVTPQMLKEDFQGMAKFVSKEEKEEILLDREPNGLVSIIVAPEVNQRGSYCFKMIISSDTWELYLYRKHKMSSKAGAGFNKEDYRRMSVPYSF